VLCSKIASNFERQSTFNDMKDLLARIDPVFDHRNRLGMMSLLVANESVDYKTLKEQLLLTDGNLASHLKPLEASGYITWEKRFINRRSQTIYMATETGKLAFSAHLDALEAMVALGREGED
jgi:DNA-binding MarR family transcriptional regulator